MRAEKIEMQKNYKAEGVHWVTAEVTETENDKAFHVESIVPTAPLK
jgi:hypothetical protein